jgi:hypothetical protein
MPRRPWACWRGRRRVHGPPARGPPARGPHGGRDSGVAPRCGCEAALGPRTRLFNALHPSPCRKRAAHRQRLISRMESTRGAENDVILLIFVDTAVPRRQRLIRRIEPLQDCIGLGSARRAPCADEALRPQWATRRTPPGRRQAQDTSRDRGGRRATEAMPTCTPASRPGPRVPWALGHRRPRPQGSTCRHGRARCPRERPDPPCPREEHVNIVDRAGVDDDLPTEALIRRQAQDTPPREHGDRSHAHVKST